MITYLITKIVNLIFQEDAPINPLPSPPPPPPPPTQNSNRRYIPYSAKTWIRYFPGELWEESGDKLSFTNGIQHLGTPKYKMRFTYGPTGRETRPIRLEQTRIPQARCPQSKIAKTTPRNDRPTQKQGGRIPICEKEKGERRKPDGKGKGNEEEPMQAQSKASKTGEGSQKGNR